MREEINKPAAYRDDGIDSASEGSSKDPSKLNERGDDSAKDRRDMGQEAFDELHANFANSKQEGNYIEDCQAELRKTRHGRLDGWQYAGLDPFPNAFQAGADEGYCFFELTSK